MKLSHRESQKLGAIYRAVHEALGKLEDIRPAGGFGEAVDHEKPKRTEVLEVRVRRNHTTKFGYFVQLWNKTLRVGWSRSFGYGDREHAMAEARVLAAVLGLPESAVVMMGETEQVSLGNGAAVGE